MCDVNLFVPLYALLQVYGVSTLCLHIPHTCCGVSMLCLYLECVCYAYRWCIYNFPVHGTCCA